MDGANAARLPRSYAQNVNEVDCVMPNPTPDQARLAKIRAAIDPITGDWFPEGEAEIHMRWLLDELDASRTREVEKQAAIEEGRTDKEYCLNAQIANDNETLITVLRRELSTAKEEIARLRSHNLDSEWGGDNDAALAQEPEEK